MSDTNDSTPAVWDPSARDGAGGWVRRGPAPAEEEPTALLPAVPDQPADAEGGTVTEPFMVRPYLPTSVDLPRPAPPTAPPTAALPPIDPPPMPLFRPDAAPAAAPTPAPGYGPSYIPPQGTPQRPLAAEPSARRGGLPLRLVLVAAVAALVLVGVVWGLSGSKSPTTDRAGATASPVRSAAGAAPSGAPSTAPSGSASASASTSTSASAGADAQAQAAAVDKLLAASVSYRQQVVDAVSAVQQCTDTGSVTAAQTSLSQAASERQAMVTQLAALDVSQIQGGAAAVQTLSRAWTESATADTDYASWAGMMAAGGCTPGNAPDTTDYDNAQSQSASATADKNSFVTQWTPIAMQYGLPTRTADAI